MANRRMIYQDFFEDDYFGGVDHTARLLWIGMISAVADDQGRMQDHIPMINAKVFMYDPVDLKKLDSYIDSFRIANKIVRYKAGGKHLIQIVKWWIYQTPAWASESRFDPPVNWIDRIKCHVPGNKQGGKIYMKNWANKGGYYNLLHSELPSGINDGDGDSDINGDDKNREEIREKELLFSFCEETQIPLPVELTHPREYIKWIREVSKWLDMGVMKNDIKSAVDKSDKAGLTLAWPGSLTKILTSEITRNKRGVKPEQNTQVYIGPDGERIERQVDQ